MRVLSDAAEPKSGNGFGLYVHIPFCVHRCSYCDFFSFSNFQESQFKELTSAIMEELKQAGKWLSEVRGYRSPVTSIFFGGGTPSLLPPHQLQRILSQILEYFESVVNVEITLEANPETVTEPLAEAWRNISLNRVSLGAQSFHKPHLKTLERLATPESVVRAVSLLRAAGFENISLDLISGIPGQSGSSFREDIQQALALEPKHLSFYTLTLKPGHRLFSELPAAEMAADLYEGGVSFLSSQGFCQYEISNFALPGYECQHNWLYWDGGDFLGVGPSSASRFFWEGQFHHRKQVSHFESYIKQPGFSADAFETSTQEQTQLEAIFLELRKNQGVYLPHFTRRYGLDLRKAPRFGAFLRQGLLHDEKDWLSLSPKGRMLADSIAVGLAE